MKGGKILQDKDCLFEQNLAAKFVREAEALGDPIHYTRALAMQCEVQALAGKYKDALATFEIIQSIYKPEVHSMGVCKAYGTDRSVHSYSQSALWHHRLGDTARSLEECEYVLEKILPHMDPGNILNTCELLLPVIRLLKPLGEEKRMRDLFNEHVVQNYEKYDVKFTPCRPIFRPLLMLLDVCHDPHGYANFDEDLEWLLEGDNGVTNDFLDTIYAKLGWAPNTLAAELCLRFARKIEGVNDEQSKAIIRKGLRLLRVAESKIKDCDGNIRLPVAYEIHEPVAAELESFAHDMMIEIEGNNHEESEHSRQNVPMQEPLRTSLGLVRLSA